MIRQLIDRLVVNVGYLGGVALIILTGIVVTDVGSRLTGFGSIEGAAETASVFLVFLVFFGMAYTQRGDGHVAMEAVQSRLPERAQKISKLISLGVCFALTAMLVLGTIMDAYHAYVTGEYQFGTVRYPFWPMKTGIAFGFFLMGVQLVIDIVQAGKKLNRRP